MVTVEVSILNDNVVEQVQEEFSVELQLDSTGGEEVIIEGAGEGTVEVVDDDSKYLTPCSHYTKKYVFSGVQITTSIHCTRTCGLLMHEINNTVLFSHICSMSCMLKISGKKCDFNPPVMIKPFCWLFYSSHWI